MGKGGVLTGEGRQSKKSVKGKKNTGGKRGNWGESTEGKAVKLAGEV